MPTKWNVDDKFYNGWEMYIDANEKHGISELTTTLEPVEEYVRENIKLDLSTDPNASFTATCKVNKWILLKLLGVSSWVLDNCPNKRVVHLAKYARKEKTRSKNFKRAIRLIAKLYANK